MINVTLKCQKKTQFSPFSTWFLAFISILSPTLFHIIKRITMACRCNHDLKLIVASSKDGKTLIYYITKTTIYTLDMSSLLHIANLKVK
jgi:hypothetical protein